MLTVAILGCGWLGFPLAKQMAASGMKVRGSTTSQDKLETFKKEGIEPHFIVLGEKTVEGDIMKFLDGADVLIIDVPPGIKSGGNFTHKMRTLIPYIEQSGTGRVLFVSSISVYGPAQGHVTEETLPQPETESGRQLLEAEKLLLGNTNFESTVLRFGGLMSEKRHPVYHLAGKENLADPDAPVNLIHLNDCIGIILRVIEQDTWGETFNAVAPGHPTRKDYYTAKAMEAGLPLPRFSEENASEGKVVGSNKVSEMLGYTFREPL